MRLRHVVSVGVVMVTAFFAIEALRTSPAPQPAPAAPVAASVPAVFAELPRQTATTQAPFAWQAYRIRPLADFSIRARVLSRENYRLGREADLSPVDLALGWKRMAEPAHYQALNITQGGRWYRYSWRNQPPIPAQEIIASSANMHMVPASAAVRAQLAQVRQGDWVRLRGRLIEATHADGWRWTSSLTRADSGTNACELVWVESLEIER